MDEPVGEKVFNVIFGELFSKHFVNFPAHDRRKIFDFATHLKDKGFTGLPGRNKPSTDVDRNDHKFMEKVQYARENNLYHYHIGIPYYDESNEYGNWTSEYILHYAKLGDDVKIIDLDNHPPFALPPKKYLK